MSAADLAVVLVSVAGVAALVALALTVQATLRTLREVRLTLAEVRAETVPLVRDMRDTVAQAGAEVERVDQLLDAAESIQRTVESASRLTYVAFSNPLIKVVAFFRGIGRALGRVFGAGGRRRRRVGARRAERDPGRAA